MAESNRRNEMDEADRIDGLSFENLDFDQMDLVYLYVRKKDRDIHALEEQALVDEKWLQGLLQEKEGQESEISNLEENIRTTQQEMIRQMNAREGARGARILLETKIRDVEDEIAVCNAESEERQREMKRKLAHWKERFEKFQEHLRTFEDYRVYTELMKEAKEVETENMELHKRIKQLEDFLYKMEEYKVSGMAVTDEDRNFLSEYAKKWIKAPDENFVKTDGENMHVPEIPNPTESSMVRKRFGMDTDPTVVSEIVDQVEKVTVSKAQLSTVIVEEVLENRTFLMGREDIGMESNTTAVPVTLDQDDRITVSQRSEAQSNFPIDEDEEAESASTGSNDAYVPCINTSHTAGVSPTQQSGVITPELESSGLVPISRMPKDSPVSNIDVNVPSMVEKSDLSAFISKADKQTETVPQVKEVGVASPSVFKIPFLLQTFTSNTSNVTTEPPVAAPNPQESPKLTKPAYQFPDFSAFKKKSATLPPFRFLVSPSVVTSTTTDVPRPVSADATSIIENPAKVEPEPAEKATQALKPTVLAAKVGPPASTASSRLSSLTFKLSTPKPSPKIPSDLPSPNLFLASTGRTHASTTISTTENTPRPLTPKIPSKLLTSTIIPSVSVPTSSGISASPTNTTRSPFSFASLRNIPKPSTPTSSVTSSVRANTLSPSISVSPGTFTSTTNSTTAVPGSKFSFNLQLNVPKPQTPKIPVKPLAPTTPTTLKATSVGTSESTNSKISLLPQLQSVQRNLTTQSPKIQTSMGVSVSSFSTNMTQAPLAVTKVPADLPSGEQKSSVFKTPQVPAPKACATTQMPSAVNSAPKHPVFSFKPVAGTSEKKVDDEADNFFAAFGKVGTSTTGTEPAKSDGVSQPGSQNSSTGMPKSYLDFGTMGQFATDNSDAQEFSIHDFFNLMPNAPSPSGSNDFRLSFQDDSQQSSDAFKFL